MESPIRGDKEEGAHIAGAGLPAAKTPPAGGEAVPRSRGALAEGGAEESHPADTTPGGAGEEVKGRLSPAVPPPPAAGSEPRSREALAEGGAEKSYPVNTTPGEQERR